MNRSARICFVLLALPLWTSAAAQEMHKCKDAAGKITYSSTECQGLGLTSAGEISDRVTVQPAVRSSSQSGGAMSDGPPGAVVRRPAQRPAPAPQAGADPADQAAAKPPPPDPDSDPNRRCFSVKTAKGTATRCNDTPAGTGAAGSAEN